ncbi:MAG: endonuclease III [Lachnospiraceae bacterium]|nr:endonuclease III [Lachnospiraceae bacterium]
MRKEERIKIIIERLNNEYGDKVRVYLNHENAWQLLVATILSAQCTDDRVNIVTKDLFRIYPTLEDLANADIKELEKVIHSTGFYSAKAKNIKGTAGILVEKYNGEVPTDIESLTSLPGVGRKTANVVRGNIYNIPSIVVDTHVKRVSKRLGITKNTDPVKVEFDLMKALPKEQWIAWNIQIIALGRSICKSQRPKCEECFLKDVCKKVDVANNSKK